MRMHACACMRMHIHKNTPVYDRRTRHEELFSEGRGARHDEFCSEGREANFSTPSPTTFRLETPFSLCFPILGVFGGKRGSTEFCREMLRFSVSDVLRAPPAQGCDLFADVYDAYDANRICMRMHHAYTASFLREVSRERERASRGPPGGFPEASRGPPGARPGPSRSPPGAFPGPSREPSRGPPGASPGLLGHARGFWRVPRGGAETRHLYLYKSLYVYICLILFIQSFI